MNGLRVVYHLARADYLERARRSSFLIILGLTVVAGYFYLPANSSTARTLAFTLDFTGYRGAYNSAWVGMQVALFGTLWLSLIGFYLVKNTLERDVRTGVGQIIATTQLRKAHYALGKTLSNFTVLATIVVVLAVAAGVMQLVRGEDTHIDPRALFSPFVFIMLPAMAVVAAGAILFECVSWLRGTVGNVAYALLFVAVLSITAEGTIGPAGDLLGLNIVLQQMQQAVKMAVPGSGGGFDMSIYFGVTSMHTFHWAGMQWTAEVLWSRLLWVGVALATVLLAALFFTRFDPANVRQKRAASFVAPALLPEASQESGVSVLANSKLTPLLAQNRRWRWTGVLVSEVRLMVQGVPWWWFLGAAALSALCLFLPFDVARLYLFPVAWLWSLPIWSALGNREARYHTEQLVFYAAHPLVRQVPMQWLAGVLMALLTASGMIAHFAIVSDWPGLLVLGVGAVFIPALALAAGVWTGNSRLFEVVFVVLWYVGAINHVPALDFMGVTGTAVAIPLAYGCAAIALFVLACVGRQRQVMA